MLFVGQKVICIDDKIPRGFVFCEPLLIKKGQIYTVREVGLKSWINGDECIRLSEIIRNPDVPYWSKRFRPIVDKQTDIQFAYDILNKINSPEKENV